MGTAKHRITAFAAAGLLLTSTGALANGSYDTAEVLSSEPIVERVTHSVPREVCREETVAYHDQPRVRSATGPLLGAIIGGAIGNAVGSGKRNKQVGVAVGALLGGSIGRDVARQRHVDGAPVSYRTRQVCDVVRDYREEERITGYRVTYAYAGRTYETRTATPPGDTIDVRVDVSPAF